MRVAAGCMRELSQKTKFRTISLLQRVLSSGLARDALADVFASAKDFGYALTRSEMQVPLSRITCGRRAAPITAAGRTTK
jgi:mitochondrial fission protein ELM1